MIKYLPAFAQNNLFSSHRVYSDEVTLITFNRPQPEEPVPLYEATVAMEAVQSGQKTKAVVQL